MACHQHAGERIQQVNAVVATTAIEAVAEPSTSKAVVTGVAHQAAQAEARRNAVVAGAGVDELIRSCPDQRVAGVRALDRAAEGRHMDSGRCRGGRVGGVMNSSRQRLELDRDLRVQTRRRH